MQKNKLRDALYAFSGGDPQIISQCNEQVQARFYTIGVFIPVIFAICFAGSSITFMQMCNSRLINVMLSLFLSAMITNIYILMLYTSSRTTLPHTANNDPGGVSVVIRFGFVCFIALVMSKPIETFLYADTLNRDIETFKAAAKKESRKKILFYYKSQCDEIKRISNDKTYAYNIIIQKNRDMKHATEKMYRIINGSYYYLQRIRFLAEKHPSCWIITHGVILLFMLPLYLKYNMHNNYYAVKDTIEKQMIEEEYAVFKKEYTDAFEKASSKRVMYSEPYADAPFNTIKKQDSRKFGTEQNLISELYNA